MNELQEELDAINFAEADELSLTIGVAWRTFLKCISSLWPLALICAIPPVCIIANIPFEEIFERMELDPEGMQALKVQIRIESIVEFPFSTVLSMTAMVASVRAIAGRRLGALANLRTAMCRLPAFIGTFLLLVAVLFGIVFGLAILLGFLYKATGNKFFVGIAGPLILAMVLAFAVKCIFCLHSTVIGATCGTGALGESKSLVQGRWWATFGELIVVFLVLVLLATPVIAFSMVAEFLLPDAAMAVTIVKETVVTTLGFIVSMFLTVALTVLYLLRRWRARVGGCSCSGGEHEYGEGGYAQGEGNE